LTSGKARLILPALLAMRRTIVYILSTNYAGSHFLSLLLGSNSRAKHLGEVKMLRKYSEEGSFGFDGRLTRGTVLQGIGPDNIHEAYEIIFSRLPPDITLLVDASKTVRWANEFLSDDRYDKKFIHLIRDPRAILRRNLKASSFFKQLRRRWWLFRDYPSLRPSIYFKPQEYVWSYLWLRTNQQISQFLQQHRLPHALVTYRDLATNTSEEVQRLMEHIGAPFEPAQLEYWNFEHLGTEKRSYDRVKDQKKSYFDLRWRQEIPESIQAGIAADPLINDYLRELGVRFTSEGLTRASSCA
jgi:hypothetical protein